MRWLSLVAALLALAPAAVSAQAADLGLGSRLGDPAGEPVDDDAAEPDEGEDDAEAEGEDEEEGPWAGPQIQIGYGYWKLADAYGGGDAHSATLEVFVQWPMSMLRTSFYADIGGRDYSLAGDDLVARGGFSIGFQLTELIEPLVPHISIVGTGGAVVGQRFETTVAYGFGGAGVEIGAALRIVRNLHAAISLSYLRLEMDGAAFDVFAFRAAVGL